MENENRQVLVRKRFIVILSFFLLFMVYYAVMMLMGSINKMADITNEFSNTLSGKNEIDDELFSDSAYLSLFREKSFLQSGIVMAGSDSVYLTINLTDSIVNIEISGVVVHSTRMSSIRASKILKHDNAVISSFLSKPFIITGTYATIRKEPVMIKMAPRNASEYIPDIMPDTSLNEPVSFVLEMSQGIRIFVSQEETDNFIDSMRLFCFDLTYRSKDSWRSLISVLRFKVPDYHLFIRIKVPADNAMIIYRALAGKGQAGIYI
jgi:hypothetical protein